MRKTPSDVPEIQMLVDEEQPLAPVVPIRTETTLTRYPIHRIAKKADVKIKQIKRNERGKIDVTWEVRNPPGPLAYKIDTIVINRRIDGMRTQGEIKQLFKLGSLREICSELGISPEGKNTYLVKEALRENAGALIICNLSFSGADGVQRFFEFDTTRYTVIFTGQKLPNNRKADGVWIELHPRFYEMLLHSKTRPLDYEFLRQLPPSAQRLYELLSFTMYGTLKHGRPNVQILYSEFCNSAPLTRYVEWDKVRPQMWKIHKPHIDAGYIKSVEFEETLNSQGVIDWVIKYTPGRKAKHEFKEFSKKGIEPGKTRLLAAIDPERLLSASRDADDRVHPLLIEQLAAAGFNDETARMLAENHAAAAERELAAWPTRDKSGMKNPLGWLRKAIESGDFAQPPTLVEARAPRKKTKESAAKKTREEKYNELYLRKYVQPFAAKLPAIDAEAFKIYQERCERIDNDGADLPEEAREFFKLWELAEMAQYWPEIKLLKFDDWLRKEHPEAYAG